uniref:Uncharacterized protein n=1 Tax=Candidatus Kentrum sp. SD TaxID=2126332 RepID=A0A450YF77_9GAMM|nr:MAG: hypothetical protein BECKSD772F_GA0070984_105610 [Candidatus Kentron sp. SD]VFK45730.1 MAG: hypothetical protein BECKSD772E_GA0070983_105910 [Candidatus Kentron sp. SD]VFK78461.1 MAG: hypothetical protein BECKSD772D_GA0070982_101535 [Candidatus Kentron sp. SD]
MAHFPKAETKIQHLAHEMVTGLTTHTDLFPAPPVTTEALAAALATYTEAAEVALELHAQAEHATATKDEALQVLTDDMKLPPCTSPYMLSFAEPHLRLATKLNVVKSGKVVHG